MKTLVTFDFSVRHGKSEYDWAKLLDGGVYELTRGEDYDANDSSMRGLIWTTARRHGKHVRIATTADKTGLVLMATDATPEEVAEWKAADELKKAEKKAKKEAEESEEEVEVKKPAKKNNKGGKKGNKKSEKPAAEPKAPEAVTF